VDEVRGILTPGVLKPYSSEKGMPNQRKVGTKDRMPFIRESYLQVSQISRVARVFLM
jgi:hypothetical protein